VKKTFIIITLISLCACAKTPPWKSRLVTMANTACANHGGVIEIDTYVNTHVECRDGRYIQLIAGGKNDPNPNQ